MCELNLNQKTFKGWMRNNFDDRELNDILRNGVKCGFHGLIYYHETSALYEKYHEEMWDYIYEDSDDQGISSLELLASLNGSGHAVDHVTFMNLITWFSAEHVAYQLMECDR